MSVNGIIQRFSPDHRSFGLDVLKITGLALVYFFAHRIAFFFPDSEKVLMLVWPAGGVGLAAFLLNPRRLWPALALAFYISGIAADVLLANRSLMAGVGYMAGNMIESIGCAWLILYWAKDFRNFTRIKEILPLIAGAVFVNAFSSCIGAGTSVLTRGASFIESWQSWYISDGLGILLVGPFIVAWIGVKEAVVGMRLTKMIEGVAFAAIWSLLCLLVFRPHEIEDQFVFHSYILAPLLAWAAIRLGQRGVTLALVLLLAIAIVSPAIVDGPSPWDGPDEGLRGRLLDLQQFLGFMAVIGYLMAASHADRNGAEEALRASEAHYRTLFESANDAILIIKDNVFSDCNAAATRLAGRSRQELLGQSPATFSPAMQPDGRDSRDMAVEKTHAAFEGNPQFFAWTLLRADGSPIFTEVSLNRSEGITEPTLLAIVRDITERKQSEEALLKSEKARAEAEKLAATGRMAARIAHEINNPLAGIRNAIRLFRDVIPKDCPEHAFVERTDKEIERLARTVRLMYDLHRPNQERKSDVLLEETFQDVVLLLEPLCRQHAVRVEVVSPAARIRVHIPEGAMRQVLFSLVTNAIEASRPEGVVRLGMVVDHEDLLVSVSDQGDGIPDELRNRIFEPFFSTKTGKGAEGGLGLGLPTARQLVETLGGTLEFESEIGRGTVFRICLPLARIEGVEL